MSAISDVSILKVVVSYMYMAMFEKRDRLCYMTCYLDEYQCKEAKKTTTKEEQKENG